MKIINYNMATSVEIQELIKALTLVLTKQATTKIDPFDENVETFNTYVKRFEAFLTATGNDGLADDDVEKTKLLINGLNPKVHQILVDLTTPDEPSTMKYTDVVTLLKNHFNPVASKAVERHRFMLRLQQPSETVSQYVAELKKIASKCDFTCKKCKASTADDHLRSQLTRGVKDDPIRTNLLKEDDKITFDQVVKNAIIVEASHAESNELKTDQKPTTAPAVNKVNQKSNTYKNYRNRPRQEAHPKNTDFRNKKPNLADLGVDKDCCLRCGLKNHTTKECKLNKNVKCNKCQKNGHLARICLTNKRKADQTPKEQNRTNYVAGNDDDLEIFNYDVGVNQVRVTQIRNPLWKKVELTLSVNQRNTTFEIDSGSPVSIMPQHLYHENGLFDQQQLRNNNVTFEGYLGDKFQPEYIAMVNVECKQTKLQLPLYIVKDKKERANDYWARMVTKIRFVERVIQYRNNKQRIHD